MPAWIINGSIEDIERRGAAQLLSSCQEFMPARSALEMLESGVLPAAAGQARALLFQPKCRAHLENLGTECTLPGGAPPSPATPGDIIFTVRTMGKG
jgi:hypothetical protein